MYLYKNAHSDARQRLRGLERIEDETTVAALQRLPRLAGLSCLEVGAGAGSIAAWLAARVGSSGKVLATDIDISHLDSSKYTVLRHDIQKDELPREAFDLVHIRHLLIHLSNPGGVLAKIRDRMKSGAYLVVEESDLRSWAPMAPYLQTEFGEGIRAVLDLYAARGMNTGMGGDLAGLLSRSGFVVKHQESVSRTVGGGSEEAAYQELSARQLADSMERQDPDLARRLRAFAECFRDPELQYRSRTTVSVSAQRVQ